MNPLLKRLRSLRRQVRLFQSWQGICALLSLVLGVAVIVGGVDYWIHLPNLVRALVLMGLLIGSGVLAWQLIYRPYSRLSGDVSLALRVEQEYPELNDALASTVEFLQQSPQSPARAGASETLRQRTIDETLAKAAQCDFSRIINRRAVVLFSAGALAVLLATGIVVAMYPQSAQTAFLRLLDPFGQHTWTRVSVARSRPNEDGQWRTLDSAGKERDCIAVDRPYKIKVDVRGKIPAQALVEFKVDGKTRTEKLPVPLERGADGTASFEAPIPMTKQAQKFQFRIVANDGAYPSRTGRWHEVEVLPSPRLVELDGQPSPQITIFPPAYTDLPSAMRQPAGGRNLKLYAGSNVVLRFRADRPLKDAWIEYVPDNAAKIEFRIEAKKRDGESGENPSVSIPAAALSFLGQTNPQQACAQLMLGYAAWGRFHARPENESCTYQIAFMPWISGHYNLRLVDLDELDYSETNSLNVQIDPVPDVKLVLPGSSVNVLPSNNDTASRYSITAVPGANVVLKFRVLDEIFAVKSAFVEFRRTGPEAGLSEPRRIVLYQAGDQGKQIPALLAKLGTPALTGPDWLLKAAPVLAGQPMRLRWKELDCTVVWALPADLREGETYEVVIGSDDFCDIYYQRQPGLSPPIELTIVGKRELIAKQQNHLAGVEEKLNNAERKQENALNNVKETQQKEKIDPSVRENFNSGSHAQQEVEKIIGKKPDEGLRREIDEIIKTLEQNGMADTKEHKQATMIKGALDGMAERDLKQIKQNMQSVGDKLNEPDAQDQKNTPDLKKKLEATARLQNDVLKGIKELRGELAPELKMSEARDKLRNAIENQQRIQKELERIREVRSDVEKITKDPSQLNELAKQQKEMIGEKTQEQIKLAQEVENIVKELRALQEKRAQEGDKENARRLKEAIDQLAPKDNKPKQEPMPPQKPTSAKMKEVAEGLKDKSQPEQRLLDQQKEIVKDLDQALGKLEDRNQKFAKQDMTREAIQERMKAEKDIQKLSDRLKEQQEKAKKIDQIMDKEERLKQKEKLAQENKQLQQDIEKTARMLERLQEPQAAEDLRNAAENLDPAKNMGQADNGQQDQKDAQKKLEQAQKKLQEAEEALSREMLVQIAEKLKSIEEQQKVALQRSEEFHPKIMKKKSWSEALLSTIEGNIDVQKNVAEETDSLKEKLKDAKVYHSILERAKESMDKASEAMTGRRDEGKDRRYIEKGDGELMDAKELQDETEAHSKTIKQQKLAMERLGRLLDALKQEIAKKDDEKAQQMAKKEEKKDDNNMEDPPRGNPNADGIPYSAQIKVLIGEQTDLKQRTQELAKLKNKGKELTMEQLDELNDLHQEQERLQELFNDVTAVTTPPQVTAPPQKEGEMP